jgi:hypothetical protein
MNCQVVQNKIIALADPRLVPDALREHLAGCAACRDWAQQAARLEGLLEDLPAPAPPADRKAALVEQITLGAPIITRPLAMPAGQRESRLAAFLQRNAVVIAGLAAAILVAVGIWNIFPRASKPDLAQPIPDDPFLKKMVARDLDLAKADTPAKRLVVLGGMAEDLSVQARSLARVASADELRDLARWYDKVVKGAIVKQAEKMHGVTLTPAEAKARAEMLGALTKQLGDSAAETDKLLNSVPPGAKPVLQKIADAARDGQKLIGVVELRGEKDKN